MTTEIARSAWPLAASTTPTACSTALPAIATITRPANCAEIPSWSIVGRSASTNHSDTNAAPSPPSASRMIDVRRLLFAGGRSSGVSLRR